MPECSTCALGPPDSGKGADGAAPGGASMVQTEACTAGVKIGYWLVGCYADRSPDPNRTFYDNVVKGLDKVPMARRSASTSARCGTGAATTS